MREAAVVDGALGPRIDVGVLRTAEDVNAYVGAVKEGEVVFVSNSKNLMVMLKKDSKRVIGDIVVEEPHRMAQFQNGVYRTSDPWEIETLKKSNSFGISRLFWDAAEMKQAADEAQFQAFVGQLERNPELRKRVKLSVGILPDFEPSAPPSGIKPIAGI
jgi:hypothetical protein